MRAYQFEHIEHLIALPGKPLSICDGYQQWIDHNGWLWYRGSFKLNDEYGYHDSFHVLNNKMIGANTIYYIK
jgi:hypothetical protein